MKSLSLFALRMATALWLGVWGAIRIFAPDAAIGFSDNYYAGVISSPELQEGLGIAEITLAAFVLFGLFRFIVYPLQAAILIGSMIALGKYIADPLGLYLLNGTAGQVLFFPWTVVAMASLALIALRSEDGFALDRLIWRR